MKRQHCPRQDCDVLQQCCCIHKTYFAQFGSVSRTANARNLDDSANPEQFLFP